jgi:hypothetical protein
MIVLLVSGYPKTSETNFAVVRCSSFRQYPYHHPTDVRFIRGASFLLE